MATIAATGAQGSITISNLRVTTPSITNLSLPVASTEVSLALPTNTVRFTIKARGNAKLQYAYVSTESGTKYITIWPGDERTIDNINRVTTTLYIQSSKAGAVAEIESWV